MLILSCSMTKSGSAWYVQLTNDLLVAAGFDDKIAVRERLGLGDLLKWDTCHLSRPNGRKLRRLVRASELGHTFCVHTHCGPLPSIRRYLREGKMRSTYIFRDPRDVVVSAFEHGARERAAGRRWASFARLRTIDLAIYWVLLRQLPRYRAWRRLEPGLVHFARYEDLVAEAGEEVRRLARFLEVSVRDEVVAEIAGRYRRDVDETRDNPTFHFHKGRPGRFREDLPPAKLRTCNRLFRGYLEEMGYER